MNYQPQASVAEMMTVFGQETRLVPRMIDDPKERLLAANLVVEESLEFAKALGFDLVWNERRQEFTLEPNGESPNLVDAADAIGDTLVVTYGAANRLGIDAYPVFQEVHRSNLTKVWPDGSIHRRESDGKVLKPSTYSPANIVAVLQQQIESSLTKIATEAYPAISNALAKGQNLWSFIASEAFGFTYNTIEQAKEIGPTANFLRPFVAYNAGKIILSYFQCELDSSDLAAELDVPVVNARELLEQFVQRFPKLAPKQPEYRVVYDLASAESSEQKDVLDHMLEAAFSSPSIPLEIPAADPVASPEYSAVQVDVPEEKPTESTSTSDQQEEPSDKENSDTLVVVPETPVEPSPKEDLDSTGITEPQIPVKEEDAPPSDKTNESQDESTSAIVPAAVIELASLANAGVTELELLP